MALGGTVLLTVGASTVEASWSPSTHIWSQVSPCFLVHDDALVPSKGQVPLPGVLKKHRALQRQAVFSSRGSRPLQAAV